MENEIVVALNELTRTIGLCTLGISITLIGLMIALWGREE